MKKIFSFVAVAMMAIFATVFTSCSKDDDPVYTFAATVESVEADDASAQSSANSQLSSFLSSKLKGMASVEVKNDSVKITTSQLNETQAALQAITDEELNTVMHKTSVKQAYIYILQTNSAQSVGVLKSYKYVSSYSFQIGVSQDILDIFDIKTTRTNGTETLDYTCNKAQSVTMTYQDKSTYTYDVIASAVDTFSPVNSANVSVVTTVTLKSNWKELVENKKEWEFNAYYQFDDGQNVYTNGLDFGAIDSEERMEEGLNRQAELIAKALSFNK